MNANLITLLVAGLLLTSSFATAEVHPTDAAVSVSGHLEQIDSGHVTLNSSSPPIDDGWSVAEHPDDRKFSVDSHGRFEFSFAAPQAAFHRITVADQVIEFFAQPGDSIKFAVDAKTAPSVTFTGDQHAANNYLIAVESAINVATRSGKHNGLPVFSFELEGFIQILHDRAEPLLANHLAFVAEHPTVSKQFSNRVLTDINSTFDAFRLLYPTVYRETTGDMAKVDASYYRDIAENVGVQSVKLSSKRFIRFIDTYADLESALESKFDSRDLPREKLMARYNTIKAMPADKGVKNYLYEQMFNTFQTNYGPADWTRVVQAFAHDYPHHALLASIQADHQKAMAVREQADEIRIYRSVGGVELEAHIFFPANHQPSDQRTAYLTFHGGGWAIGTPEWAYSGALAMAEKGLVAVSFEYRIADVHGSNMLDAIDDTKAAIRWARDQGEILGINPAKVVAHGFSAGAHLVGTSAMSPIAASQDAPTRPNAVILHSSTYNTTKGRFFMAMTGNRAEDVSLFHQVKEGLVPAILFHGKYDHLAPEAEFEEFVGRMQQLDNNFEHHLFNVGHFFRSDSARAEVSRLTDAFLVKHGFLDP